ncbi:MAG: DUF3079 domain-containing protein [Betaproteobacteria bacterium]|nr:DUF3079 domain-containing protein [Betaproteobacteria bacterium]MDE2123104.1 DUF3079 domain-containing protein [Betaproteobacteria bacterium]MDE2185532.1 DUF3079 domain-containing protein [Betaproteobacteria bacterium]MDE2323906.1 DUF3079 domain-containing protein [Betaproteobacteria bacterium]
MVKKFPTHPIHPERICWGCARYCAADSMRCGNGSERTQHPVELLGQDWLDFGLDASAARDAGSAEQAPVRDTSAASSGKTI